MITASAAPRATGDQVVLTSAGDTMGGTNTPMHRDKHKGDREHEAHRCVAEEEVVIGPVCVDINELEVLSDILST